jgi:6-pyruvoyltetrahydropterin/6-carboxytetrahydropterin synthase
MLQITKIFRFEAAHAIHGYAGKCRNVHGHSYVLHVTVGQAENGMEYLPAPGFIIDFKELKKVVNGAVIDDLDHALILSEDYLKQYTALANSENLKRWNMEPTAENIILHIKDALEKELPESVLLRRLKLYETNDSYAEWERG